MHIYTYRRGRRRRERGREGEKGQANITFNLFKQNYCTNFLWKSKQVEEKGKEQTQHRGMVRTQNIPALSTQCLEVKWADTSTEMEGSAVAKGN